MTEQERFQRAFAPLHAPSDTHACKCDFAKCIE